MLKSKTVRLAGLMSILYAVVMIVIPMLGGQSGHNLNEPFASISPADFRYNWLFVLLSCTGSVYFKIQLLLVVLMLAAGVLVLSRGTKRTMDFAGAVSAGAVIYAAFLYVQREELFSLVEKAKVTYHIDIGFSFGFWFAAGFAALSLLAFNIFQFARAREIAASRPEKGE